MPFRFSFEAKYQVKGAASNRDRSIANLEAFGAATRGEAPYPYSDFEMLHNIEVLDAILRSAETGQAVEL